MNIIYNKVESIKRPLIVGEILLVPCIVKFKYTNSPDMQMFITPVINHPHSDIENGQLNTHYHADFRFIKVDKFGNPINKHSSHIFGHSARPEIKLHGELMYILLPVINGTNLNITPANLIAKSKLKHNCIYNGKCPHRGYNLSQIDAIDGVITCPLHGLEFDGITKKILPQPTSPSQPS